MKLTIATTDLLNRLQAAVRVASSRAAAQALSGVMLAAKDGACRLLATDLEVSVNIAVPAEAEGDGSLVLPGRLLMDIVRSLPDEKLTIEQRPSEGDAELISGSATFHLRLLRAEDFPELPAPAAENQVKLPAIAFAHTVETVIRSASRDETRPVLTGVMVSASGQELTMVATDSYRLTVKRTALEHPIDGTLEANVPARALQEISRLAAGEDDSTIAVTTHSGQVVFDLGEAVVSSRLIDGQFPNYRALLPDSVEHELRISTSELSGVVRRMGLLAQKSTPLRLSLSEGQLAVSAETPEVGQASETIPVPFAGEQFDIGFNPDFLRDGLESVATEDVILKLISPVRPGLIESPETGEFIYLIMPIRLS